MSKRIQVYVLVALLLIGVYAYFASRSAEPGLTGVLASDPTFHPLNVEEPHLRLDLLAKIKNLEYSGSHRNIFTFGPAPPPPKTKEELARENFQKQGPQLPPPPPPVSVPAQLFGYASMPQSGKHVAFFLQGEDVLVVEEGSVFLSRYRLDKIGNDSADVEEVSSGRHATVQMTQPAAVGLEPGANPNAPNANTVNQ
ncbi:MAG: hypothetical protein WCA38_09725 [Candidatus Acidiferrales bacterium]